MAAASLWERARVPRREVPTLQEALACCDHDLLLRAILEEHAAPAREEGGAGPAARRAMEHRARAALDELCTLAVRRRDGRGRFVLPRETYAPAGGGDLIERQIEMRFLTAEDAPAARRVLAGDEGGLPARSGACEAWERSLACRVWLGGTRSVYERHRALAAAFWDLTYLGFTHEEVQAALAAAQTAPAGPPAAGVPPAAPGDALSATPPGPWAWRAEELGLAVPDALETDRRAALQSRADALNRDAERDLCRRLLQALSRTGYLSAG